MKRESIGVPEMDKEGVEEIWEDALLCVFRLSTTTQAKADAR